MNGIATPYGYFDPWMLVAAALVTVAAAYAIRAAGRKDAGSGGGRSLPFYSGNEEPADGIRSKNMYWGFFRALQRYYRHVERLHSGVVNDYVLSFAAVMAVLLLALLIGGALA